MLQAAKAEAAQTAASAAEKDPAKFSGKKSKAAAKKGAGSTQWDILIRSGIPEAEVPKFRCVLVPRCVGSMRSAVQAAWWATPVCDRARWLQDTGTWTRTLSHHLVTEVGFAPRCALAATTWSAM